MKIFYSTILTLMVAVGAYGQCTTGGSLGSLSSTAGFQTIPVSAGPAAYYTFPGVAGQTVVFSYCQAGGSQSGDSYLTVTDNTPTALTQNDDFCGLGSEISYVIPTTGTYRIYLSGCCPCSDSPSGVLAYNIPAAPNVDVCASAQAISCGATVTGTTVGATLDGPGTSCTGGSVAADHWYTIIGNGGNLTASMCDGGTTYDSKLDIYTGTCGSLTSVVCNDDACGLQSAVSWPSTAGVTYYIRVHGFSGATGNYSMTVTGATNDICTTAQTITAGTVSGTTVCTTNDVQPTCITGDGTAGGVWYSYTSASCQNVNLNTCTGTNFDSKIRVFTGSCAALTCVTGNDDFCGLYSSVDFTATAGTTYYILVHGYGSGEGNFTLALTESPETVAPVADVASLSDVTSQCSVSSVTAPTATDNCSGSVTGTTTTTFPITTQGTTVVTWTYTDGSGNTSTQNQNVVITDNTAPVADMASLADLTDQCQITSLTPPTATDNCTGTITGTTTATTPITASTTITWTYNDGNGNTSTQTQNVVINDNTAPVADNASLTDVTAECSVASITAPTATDNCSGAVTGTTTTSFPITTLGTTVVTWTYTDGSGNSSTQMQNVVITDGTAPVADAATLTDVTGECEVASLTAPTATDNCAGTITGTTTTTFPITTQGTTVVTWTYDDGNGNTSTQMQNVVITDATAPVADATSLPTETAICEVASLTAPTATDNCAGSITGTTTTMFPITASTTVTWTYDDGNGNTSTQTQEVVITGLDATTTVAGTTITSNETQAGVIYQWVDCDNSNFPIAGETNASFTATQTGNYAVMVSFENCSVISNCESITVNGINELTSAQVKVYPNPTSDILTIETTLEGSAVLIDMNGKVVSSLNIINGMNQIDVKNLATGTYTLKVSSEGGIYTESIIVTIK